jgi:hypothetical protein
MTSRTPRPTPVPGLMAAHPGCSNKRRNMTFGEIHDTGVRTDVTGASCHEDRLSGRAGCSGAHMEIL